MEDDNMNYGYEWPEYKEELSNAMDNLLNVLKKYKPQDRTIIDRHFAVAITDAEKLSAYLEVYILPPILKEE